MADADLQRQMREIERLVHELESTADPHLRSRAVELVTLLMDVHGAALRRMMELIARSGPDAGAAIGALAGDGLVASLLLLYGLHPRDLESRVLQALDKARPLLRGHGGDVELVSCTEGVVQLRLTGSCHGCPSSTLTLKHAIEEAICEFAPDVLELRVEGAVAAEKPVGGFVPLSQLAETR
jgi:Fe-S cluster biogenesis protein NfuA